jgi:glycosyltransferase involved in cell wall biosynthesis
MRRLTVVQLLPALSSGGVERSTLEVADALVAAGHRSIVVSAGGRLVDALRAAGSEHVQLDIGRKSLTTLRRVASLRRLFASVQPDIVHARSRLPAWLAWFALRGKSGACPHFLTSVHGLNSPGFYSSILTRGERVICVSQTVRAHVLAHWPKTDPEKLTVIEPGIDANVFSGAAENIDAPPVGVPGEKLLLMPGRGTRLKGHAAAIELLADLRRSGVSARLWLLGAREAGREAYVAELESLARKLDVYGFVEISVARADVVAAYRKCDLVLQLSAKPEAFGRTVIEALSAGKPVVGWAHGGVGELLGRYFPEGGVQLGDQPALLATTLRLLTESPAPARRQIQTLADAQAQTLKVYESIAG